VLAGLAFGLGVWTRPLMAAMLPGLLLVVPRSRPAMRRFIAGGIPVALAMAAVQWWLYGSPWRTGYGGTAGLFTTANIVRHLGAYAKWVVMAHSPLFLAALGLGLWRAPRRLAVGAVVGLLTGLVPYLFNLQFFDDFDVVRYLLPGLIPCLIVATMGVTAVVRRRVRAPAVALVVLGLAAAVAAASHTVVAGTATFQLQQQESRYVAVADWFRTHTPTDTVVFAGIHSGSLRLYAERATLRWALMPPRSLAATVAALARRGFASYAAVDGEVEARSFAARVADESKTLGAEPVAAVRGTTMFRLSVAPSPAGRQ
jgi:hypothetical protein